VKKYAVMIVVAAAVFLTGCWQKSVPPFYKEKDVYFEASLLGAWREPDETAEDGGTWTFAKSELPNIYNVLITDKENRVSCDGRLFRIGQERFLDLHSRDRSINSIPAHHLFRIREYGETFKLQILSMEWIKNRLQLHPNEIAHVRSHDPEHPDDVDKAEFILTAETERLQKYVIEHLNDEGFFDTAFELKKVK
jgi:hypothetical protein